MLKMSGGEAFTKVLRNKMRNYPGRNDVRYSDHFLWPSLEPRFKIEPGQTVFTIGSCFARNVEEELVKTGLNVPTFHFSAPREEAPGRANRILNQYNPATMLQAVRQVVTGSDERGLYCLESGLCIDALIATGSRPVTYARALERRCEIDALYQDGLAAADVVIITLGLVEAWYDREAGIYLNEAPPRSIVKTSERFEFHQLGVAETQEMVFSLLNYLTSQGKKIILTVSPVPLQVTFAGGDPVMRNNYSKSVLRVVAELAIQAFKSVDYYPSYEIITTAGLRAFGEDNVHVRASVVQQVVGRMVDVYGKA